MLKYRLKQAIAFVAILVPILAYGYESLVMTERVRSRVQASELSEVLSEHCTCKLLIFSKS